MTPERPPDLRTQAGPHVFVNHLESLELADHDRHHLARVLRLRDGDPLTASDGEGSWRNVRFGDVLEVAGPVHTVADPPYELWLGIALTKAAKPEFAVQKATELGIDHVVVFESAHSVARWDEAKRNKNRERLVKVAREAAMQSRRVNVPTVAIESFEAFVSRRTGTSPVRADFGGAPLRMEHRTVLIGPEGGWDAAERADVPDSVDLGATVLRAETAAVVAASHMTRLRSQAV